jgi:hypothetical protein
MQNPAMSGGVANPLEWKGGLNDHSGAVLVPCIEDEKDQAEDQNRSLAEPEEADSSTLPASPVPIITDSLRGCRRKNAKPIQCGSWPKSYLERRERGSLNRDIGGSGTGILKLRQSI